MTVLIEAHLFLQIVIICFKSRNITIRLSLFDISALIPSLYALDSCIHNNSQKYISTSSSLCNRWSPKSRFTGPNNKMDGQDVRSDTRNSSSFRHAKFWLAYSSLRITSRDRSFVQTSQSSVWRVTDGAEVKK